jgi:hypothetical protein
MRLDDHPGSVTQGSGDNLRPGRDYGCDVFPRGYVALFVASGSQAFSEAARDSSRISLFIRAIRQRT